jgi:hypothetical protein
MPSPSFACGYSPDELNFCRGPDGTGVICVLAGGTPPHRRHGEPWSDGSRFSGRITRLGSPVEADRLAIDGGMCDLSTSAFQASVAGFPEPGRLADHRS